MSMVLILILGLCAGSFLNAFIYRLEKGESALKGRSYCPHCKHILPWYDLIPVLSFILLMGRCRYCKKPISLQYPAVEILTASIFLLITNSQFLISHQTPIFEFLKLLYLWVIAAVLIIIFVYDLKYYLIPDSVVYLGIGVAFLYRIFEVLSSNNFDLIRNLGTLENTLMPAILASLFFFLIFFFSKGAWMGFGDVKLAFLMGLALGFPHILVALFSAFFLGSIVGIGLMIARKKHMKSEVPFAPFLVTGTFFALFWGESILHWYFRFALL